MGLQFYYKYKVSALGIMKVRRVRREGERGKASGGVEGGGCCAAVAAVAKAGGNVICVAAPRLMIKHLVQPVALVLLLALFSSSVYALNSHSRGRALSERGEFDSRRSFAALRGRRCKREEAAQGQGKQCRQ